jgi:hypothetical protein
MHSEYVSACASKRCDAPVLEQPVREQPVTVEVVDVVLVPTLATDRAGEPPHPAATRARPASAAARGARRRVTRRRFTPARQAQASKTSACVHSRALAVADGGAFKISETTYGIFNIFETAGPGRTR